MVDLIKADGEVTGAVAWHVGSGAPVIISAKATIVATGGLTRLYRRNSASANMGGDGYALCLRAGAPLIDMEFVQFFPIGHLAPRLIGMDPIMWDPFRYKLGGKLLNNDGEEFTQNYGVAEDGKYIITRDVGTYAILKEVEAGRGSPHGGVYLSFQHVPEAKLREAFGPVIDRLAANGIDLTKKPVEVAPIAHYHMGGVQADVHMTDRSARPAGRRRSGRRRQRRQPAVRQRHHRGAGVRPPGRAHRRRAGQGHRQASPHGRKPRSRRSTCWRWTARRNPPNTAEMLQSLQQTMADDVGPLRTRGIVSSARWPVSMSCHTHTRRAAVRRRPGLRHDPARLVRPAQHADRRAFRDAGRARPHRKPRRASARGFPRHAAGVERQPGDPARGRRRLDIERAPASIAEVGRAMSETATLKIWRGADKAAGPWETHQVPFERGQSVLDGLRWIRVHKDPTLAIRFSCINANACKECMMELDGETVYACTARLEPREMRLEPLSNKKLVRDLVTEIAPPAERFAAKDK